MQQIRRTIQATFVITLALLLVGGVVFVVGQAAGLVAGQGAWLAFFNEFFKPGMCIMASVCAVAGFLLSYNKTQDADVKQKAAAQ
ncbi:hypothetical protein [Paenarthrobacter nitroguajacolicus]|uniref:hypothetical protein n=1 Tax=Paenarthrobacter nitroguajacolicus TaxID=211146 RepID=UPI002864A7F9|nr:hypothetical protein [Paenarthrobacter nitroguajacolicus]MDR6640663.1 hypothetical protein [Paenarthrobacter nitroguajacolicus]